MLAATADTTDALIGRTDELTTEDCAKDFMGARNP